MAWNPTVEETPLSEEAKGVAVAEILSDPQKAVQTKISGALGKAIDSKLDSEPVKKEVDKTAGSVITDSLATVENGVAASKVKSTDELNTADYNKDKDIYNSFGIDWKLDAEWKKKLLKIGDNIWFAIFWFVGLFTIVPISLFLRRLNTLSRFLKGMYTFFGVIGALAIAWALITLILYFAGINYL